MELFLAVGMMELFLAVGMMELLPAVGMVGLFPAAGKVDLFHVVGEADLLPVVGGAGHYTRVHAASRALAPVIWLYACCKASHIQSPQQALRIREQVCGY